MSLAEFSGPMIHYVVELQHSAIEVHFVLNGVDIIHGAPADGKIVQQKVNGWLRAKNNEITISAAVPDPPVTGKPLDLKFLLFRGPSGRQPEEDEALHHFAERDKTKFPVGTPRTLYQTTFDADPCYGPWRWENGQDITLDRPALQAAINIINGVSTAVRAKNNAALADYFRVFIEENTRAYGGKPERQLQRMQEWAANAPSKAGRDLVPGDYSYTVSENRKLMKLARLDGLPVFQIDPKIETAGPQDVYVANLAEGWTIVR